MTKNETSELTQILKKVDSFDTFKKAHQEDLLEMDFSQCLSTYAMSSQKSTYKLINEAGLDLSYGYKIFRGDHIPSRDAIIKLAFVLKLSLQETQRLLKLGHVNELYPRNERDALILFCLNKQMTLEEAEEALFQHEKAALSL